MRPIKFRAWTGKVMRTDGAYAFILGKGGGFIREDDGWTFMQFTGLHDKNGKEIYEGDIIKLEEKVLSDNCETSTPHIETKRDDHFVYADKTVGLRVWGHEVICIDDKFGTHNDDWTDYFGYESPSAIQRGEVIGNIYENPELLS